MTRQGFRISLQLGRDIVTVQIKYATFAWETTKTLLQDAFKPPRLGGTEYCLPKQVTETRHREMGFRVLPGH